MTNYKRFKLKLLNEYELRNEDLYIDQDDYDKIFLISDDLKHIGFNKKINDLNRPVLEIKNGKRTIYRKFKQGKQFGLCSQEIGILNKDVNYLELTKGTEYIDVKIASKFGKYFFYFNNPKLDVRLTTRFFIYSIIIGIISGILSGIIVEYVKF